MIILPQTNKLKEIIDYCEANNIDTDGVTIESKIIVGEITGTKEVRLYLCPPLPTHNLTWDSIKMT